MTCGRIELYEFAIMARDVSVFTAFDSDHAGVLDAAKLRPALAKLGLAASEPEVRRIIDVWDDNREGTISLEFAEIVRDLQVFEQFDLIGRVSSPPLNFAARSASSACRSLIPRRVRCSPSTTTTSQG